MFGTAEIRPGKKGFCSTKIVVGDFEFFFGTCMFERERVIIATAEVCAKKKRVCNTSTCVDCFESLFFVLSAREKETMIIATAEVLTGNIC